jgi:hypothetical protein
MPMFSHSPDEVGTRAARPFSQFEPKILAVGQTQHVIPQMAEHPFGKGDFAAVVIRHLPAGGAAGASGTPPFELHRWSP